MIGTLHSLSYTARYFVVTHGRCVQVWDAPGHSRDFAPFSLLRSYPGQYDNTTCIEWSEDSRCVCVFGGIRENIKGLVGYLSILPQVSQTKLSFSFMLT